MSTPMDAPSNSVQQVRYRAIADQAVGGIVLTDFDDRFLLVNERWCEMLGYTMAEMLQLSICDLAFPEERADVERNLSTLVKNRASVEIERRYRRKDGTGVWLSLSVANVCDDAGNPEAIMALAVDITKRRAAAALNAFLADLADRCSHISDMEDVMPTTARSPSDPPRWRRPRSPWPCR